MRINKYSLIAALLLGGAVAGTSVASAQTSTNAARGQRRAPNMEQRMDRLSQELKLTDEQKPKVKAALEDMAKKRQELFSDSSVPREQRREKMQTMMADENKKMKEILNADQFEKWQKMQAEMRQRRPNAGANSAAPKAEPKQSQ
jgi:hypothetical protein